MEWKTDIVEGSAVARRAAHYAPQVLLYARLWERLSGEKVKEIGLYFTHPGTYVEIKAAT